MNYVEIDFYMFKQTRWIKGHTFEEHWTVNWDCLFGWSTQHLAQHQESASPCIKILIQSFSLPKSISSRERKKTAQRVEEKRGGYGFLSGYNWDV